MNINATAIPALPNLTIPECETISCKSWCCWNKCIAPATPNEAIKNFDVRTNPALFICTRDWLNVRKIRSSLNKVLNSVRIFLCDYKYRLWMAFRFQWTNRKFSTIFWQISVTPNVFDQILVSYCSLFREQIYRSSFTIFVGNDLRFPIPPNAIETSYTKYPLRQK